MVPGLRIGRYVLERRLGRGGMGEVWRARLHGDLGFSKPVALKVLPEVGGRQAEALLHEARIGAALKHPNIVDVYEFVVEDGEHLLAMELIDGPTVEALLDAHPDGLPADVARAIVGQMASGLAYAHALRDDDDAPLGLVHRDLKPGNLMVARSGLVKIVDFGIAKVSFAARRSQTGELKGTLHYMSPEQLRGARGVTAATDLWALGLIAAELALGDRLVPGGHPGEVVAWVLALDVDAIASRVGARDPTLGEVVRRTLVVDPEGRATAAEVRALLSDDARPDGLAAWVRQAAPSLPAETVDVPSDSRSTWNEPAVTSTMLGSTEDAEVDVPSMPPRRRGRWGWAVLAGVVAVAAAAWWVPSRSGGTLHLAVPHERAELDVYAPTTTLWSYVQEDVQEPLLRISDRGAVEPWVIASWEQDDATVHLTLRDGVWFADHPCLPGGARAEPADVAWSLELAAEADRLAGLPLVGLLDPDQDTLEGVHLDDDGVTLDLAEPAPFLLHALADVKLLPRALEGCDDPRDPHQPAGSGPFRFTGPAFTDELVLARHDRSWRTDVGGASLPHLDALVIVAERDPDATLARLVAGELDMAVIGTRTGHLDDLPDGLRDAPFGSLLEVFKGVLVLPRPDGPLRDDALRRALNARLDRGPIAAAHDPPLMPSARLTRPTWLGHDPLLTANEPVPDGPLADGVELRIGAFSSDLPVAEEMAAQVAALGFTPTVVQLSQATLGAQLRDPTVDLAVVQADVHTWGIDPYPFLESMVPKLAPLGFVSDEAWAASGVPRQTAGRSDRGRAYAALEAAILHDAAVFPLGWLEDDRQQLRVVDRGDVEGVVDWETGLPLGGLLDFAHAELTAP